MKNITLLKKNKGKNKKDGTQQQQKQQSSPTKDSKANNNNQSSPKEASLEATQSSPKEASLEATQSSPKVNQSSPKVTPPKNDIIPNYEKKKKMSDQLVELCNNVLVLTQMVNNANTQKGNLIKQYKTVIRGIQSSFKNINDENVYRTKSHII